MQNFYEEDYYGAPVEFTATEDFHDVEAVEVPETDLFVTRIPERKSLDEHLKQKPKPEPQRARSDKEKYYADPAVESPLVTIEEHLSLVSNSRDSKNTLAAKSILCELLSRAECSRPTVAVYKKSGGITALDCAPSGADFAADIFLCAKSTLPLPLYRIFGLMVSESFERWAEVPAIVRRMILENTGGELIRRKIWSRNSGTRKYWENTFKKSGRKRTVAERFRVA
jgi:hypothetical protein